MEKLKKLLSSSGAVILGIMAVLIGLFFRERNKRQEAEADLAVADTDKKAAVLEEKLEEGHRQLNALDNEVKDKLSNMEDLKHQNKDLSDDELKKFYKDKL